MSDYEEGYKAFINHQQFVAENSREWKAGYLRANYDYTHESKRPENEEPDFSASGGKIY